MTQYKEYIQSPDRNNWFRFGNVTEFRPVREKSELFVQAIAKVVEGELILSDTGRIKVEAVATCSLK